MKILYKVEVRYIKQSDKKVKNVSLS